MAEYVPLYEEDCAITRQASAAITAGQLVRVSGDGTVAPTTAASADWLGVAGQDAAIGAQVTVWTGGVQRIATAAAIAAGLTVEGAASGRVAAHTNGTNDVNIVGLTLSATTGAGQLADVFLAR